MPTVADSMFHVPSRRAVTSAIQTMVAAATGRPIGIMRAPYKNDDVEQIEDPPYSILYPISGGGTTGSYFSHPDDEYSWTYQFTSVALRDDQCEWMADAVRQAMLGREDSGAFKYALSVTNLQIMSREPAGSPSGMNFEANIYSIPETFFVRVTLA